MRINSLSLFLILSLSSAVAGRAGAGTGNRRLLQGFVPGSFGSSLSTFAELPCDEADIGFTERMACRSLMNRGLDWRKTPGYKMLEALFEDGEAPTAKSVKGWRAGRRFMRDPPGKTTPPQAALQGTLTVRGDGGPLTGALYKVRMFFGYSPEYVDSFTPELVKVFKEAYHEWTSVTLPEFGEKDMRYKSAWDSEAGAEEKTYLARRFGSWIIVKYADGNRFGGVDRSFYCYFYKNVTPVSEKE